MMASFDLGELEKLHLALDMAQRFVRGESYHGDKPQVLLQEFDRMMEKVRDFRHTETYSMERANGLDGGGVQDAE